MVETSSGCSILLSRQVRNSLSSFLLFIFIGNVLQGANLCNASSTESVTLLVEYNPEVGVHVVKLGLGTPKRTLTLLVDNNLDVSWTQCEPCFKCYQQMEPIFDPSNSNSYRTVPCTSPYCSTGCSNSACAYSYRDGDDNIIKGKLSTDVVFLNDKVSVEGFTFGCGTTNYVRYIDKIAGSFGLGTGPLSFLSLTAKKYNERFSYCLPLPLANSSGFLSFGGKGLSSKSAQFVPFSQFIPFTLFNRSTNYMLDLVGISVGGKSLRTALSVSNPLPILIDTRTSVTRLTGEIYAEMRNEFRKRMSKYPMIRESVSPASDTCFNISGQTNVTVPAIEFTFSNGVVLPLASSGILNDWNSTVTCFPFWVVGDGLSDYAIFGIAQQSTFEIVYDNPNKRIGFIKDGCSKEGPFKCIVVVGAAPLRLTPVFAMAMISVLALTVLLNYPFKFLFL